MAIAYIPSNLNLEKILKKNAPNFKYHFDEFLYLLDSVSRVRARYKDYHDIEYVPLNAQIMQKRVRLYNQYLQYLLTNGVLETNGSYVPGSRSRGYKFNIKLANSDLEPYLIHKTSLIKENKLELQHKKAVKNEYGYLTKWFNDELLVDMDKAQQILDRLLQNDRAEREKIANRRYINQKLSIQMILDRDYFYNVDKTSKRFHSNLTNLKSELRNTLSYKGQTLCSIDLKNSQPFISTLLLTKEFYEPKPAEGGKLNLFTISKELYSIVEQTLPTLLPTLPGGSLIMLVKRDVDEAKTNLERYATLVDKGQFYSYFARNFLLWTGKPITANVQLQKSKVKEALFAVFFSDNRFFRQPDALPKRVFKAEFPEVYRVFELLKSKHKNTLSIILQTIESEVMIRRAAKRIGEQLPELPIYTIHDSIVTLNSDRDIVRGIIKEEWQKVLGLEPNLHFEVWE